MGLLDDYQIDLDEVEASNFDVPDDWYQFVVGDLSIVEGTRAHPDTHFIVLKFLLGDINSGESTGKSKSEWTTLPVDSANRTAKEEGALSRWKTRLLSLGIAPENVASVGPEDVIGLSGTLQIVSSKSKTSDAVYQNIKNLTMDEVDGEAEEEPVAPAAKAPTKAPARPAAAEKAAAVGVRKNPFAGK